MRLVLTSLLFLTACDANQEVAGFEGLEAGSAEELSDASAADPTLALRNPLTLASDPLTAGDPANLTVTGLAPGEWCSVAYSLNGIGNGPCPAALGGQCLDLRPPVYVLGSARANASGVATLGTTVPAGAPVGLDVSLQAVAVRGLGGAQSVTSAAIVETVVAPTCADYSWSPMLLPATTSGLTTGMDDDATPSCASSSTAPDATFSFVSPVTRWITLDTVGSGFDTVLSVYDGCGGALLACNDDSYGLTSAVTVPVTAGVPIIVIVDGFGTQSGAIHLRAY